MTSNKEFGLNVRRFKIVSRAFSVLHKEMRFSLTQMGFRVTSEKIAEVWENEIEDMFEDVANSDPKTGTNRNTLTGKGATGTDSQLASNGTALFASDGYRVEVDQD